MLKSVRHEKLLQVRKNLPVAYMKLSLWHHPVNPIDLATYIFSYNHLENVYIYGFQSF